MKLSGGVYRVLRRGLSAIRRFGSGISNGVRRALAIRYDAAQTTDDNAKHWRWADDLSARAALNPEVRRVLRNRARYERANNTYAQGMVVTLANDLIGTGPRLKITSGGSKSQDKRIEKAFRNWAFAVNLAEKLHGFAQSRIVDGEAFFVLSQNKGLAKKTPVALDVRPIEAEQVAAPPGSEHFGDPAWRDGIKFDDDGNVVSYSISKSHPGDKSGATMLPDLNPVDANYVIHWYRQDRPGQIRGVPEFTPALPIFALLRRWKLARVMNAETGANIAGVIESEQSAFEGEGERVGEILLNAERNMFASLPIGWRLKQFQSATPSAADEAFARELIGDIGRCLIMPFNIAALNSASYNYSSGRLDHRTYYRHLRVMQSHLEAYVLDRIFTAFLGDMVSSQSLPGGMLAGLPKFSEWNWTWNWDAPAGIDEVKEANAAGIRMSLGLSSLSRELRQLGIDRDELLDEMADDDKAIEVRGIKRLVYVQPGAPAPAVKQADEDTEEPANGQKARAA